MSNTFMPLPDDSILHLDQIKLELTLDAVLTRLGKLAGRQNFLEAATSVFRLAQELWQPQLVMRWLTVGWPEPDRLQLADAHNTLSAHLDLGHSNQFIRPARLALVAAYTVGPAIETRARTMASEQRYLDSYLLEQIALFALNQTGQVICRHAEDSAARLGWGVGPFLSPGSVHGWELCQQPLLCTLLPLERATLTCSDQGVLSPFNSLTCLIGIGPDYPATTVGDTCTVCARRDNCQQRALP